MPGWGNGRAREAGFCERVSGEGETPTTLILVLVTGIQPREVLRVKRLSCVADATLLDPCDEHRDEGCGGIYVLGFKFSGSYSGL